MTEATCYTISKSIHLTRLSMLLAHAMLREVFGRSSVYYSCVRLLLVIVVYPPRTDGSSWRTNLPRVFPHAGTWHVTGPTEFRRARRFVGPGEAVDGAAVPPSLLPPELLLLMLLIWLDCIALIQPSRERSAETSLGGGASVT